MSNTKEKILRNLFNVFYWLQLSCVYNQKKKNKLSFKAHFNIKSSSENRFSSVREGEENLSLSSLAIENWLHYHNINWMRIVRIDLRLSYEETFLFSILLFDWNIMRISFPSNLIIIPMPSLFGTIIEFSNL